MFTKPKSATSASLLLALAVGGCAANHGQKPATGTDSIPDTSVAYALPRTVIEVRAPVTLKKPSAAGCFDHGDEAPVFGDPGIPGDPAARARKRECSGDPTKLQTCLGFSDNLAQKYALGEVAITTRAEADPDQIYSVPLTGTALQKRRVLLELAESGLLIQGESESRSKALSFFSGLFKSVAGLASVFVASEETPIEKCQQTAREILDLRVDARRLREAVLAGHPTPPETAKLFLERFEAGEKKLMEAFAETAEVTGNVYCEVRPREADVATFAADGKLLAAAPKTIDLFQVRSTTGVCAGRPAQGETCSFDAPSLCFVPEPLRAAAGGEPKKMQQVSLTLSYVSEQFAQTIRERSAPTTDKADEDRSFRYRVPALAGIDLVLTTSADGKAEAKTLSRQTGMIAQFGPVGSLPGKGADLYTLALYPDTGAIKKITSLREPTDATDTTSIVDSITSVVKADKASDDELAQLERERKILEERKKIRDFKAELGEDED